MSSASPTFEELLPLSEFELLYCRAMGAEQCRGLGCYYKSTTCHMDALCELMREWWRRQHASKHRAELELLTAVIDRHRQQWTSRFYYLFWDSVPAERVRREIVFIAAEDRAAMNRNGEVARSKGQ